MPAIRAAASTSPLVMALLATLVVVSGSMETRQRARARRCVGSRGVTSTMRAPPSGSRWARLRSDTKRDCTRLRVPTQGVHLPTYEYACTACGHRLDAVQKFSDEPLTECPECGGTLRKVY